MFKQTKAGASTPAQNQKLIYADGKEEYSGFFNYRKSADSGQCKKCRSDYMKFSVDGFCQNCQQKVEFIVREHPHIARDARNQKQEAMQ